jgi:hypothetical protein
MTTTERTSRMRLVILLIVLLAGCSEAPDPDWPLRCSATIRREVSRARPGFLVIRPDPNVPVGCPGVPSGYSSEFALACSYEDRVLGYDPRWCLKPPQQPYLMMERPVRADVYYKAVAEHKNWWANWPTSLASSLDDGSVGIELGFLIGKVVDFCTSIDARSCTELEWERAMRGNENFIFLGADAPPETCSFLTGVDQIRADPPRSPFGVVPAVSAGEAFGSYYKDYVTCQDLEWEECDCDTNGLSFATEVARSAESALYLRYRERTGKPLNHELKIGDHVAFRCCADITEEDLVPLADSTAPTSKDEGGPTPGGSE